MTTTGVDYSDPSIPPSVLTDHDVKFAIRYVSHPGNPKNITLAEAEAHAAIGVKTVTVFESVAGRALAGEGAGRADMLAASQQAFAAGQPFGTPIYFAVDFDMIPADETAVGNYFTGVWSAAQHYKVGAYGGIEAVTFLDGKFGVSYLWQTYAWSHQKWNAHADLRQTHNGVRWGRYVVDLCDATMADYGGWYPNRPARGTDPGAPIREPAPVTDDWMTTIMDRLAQIKQGDHDPVGGQAFVRRAQAILGPVCGLNAGPVDGIFGPTTLGAVKAFQQTRHLTVDGIVGPKTWSYLITGTAL